MTIELRIWDRVDATVQAVKRAIARGDRPPEVLENISHWERVAYKKWDPKEIPDGWHLTKIEAEYDIGFYQYVVSKMPDPPLPFWDDRCYEVFAHLAGVRNSHDITPISSPRGLPPGVDDDIYFGDHSYSWLLAKEILDHPGWYLPQQRRGLVSTETARKFSEGIMPDTWWGGSSRPSITYEEFLRSGGINVDVYLEWSEVVEFEVVNMAQAWADRYGAENVRFVFGFDS